jgi:hypothetical protein
LNSIRSEAVAVYATPSAIFAFVAHGFPVSISIQEGHERANSLDSAEDEAISDIRERLASYQRNGYDRGWKNVEVEKEIGSDFACPPTISFCPPSTKITSISREDGGWRLVIHNRWDQEVILDSKFALVSTRRLPDAPSPRQQP